MVYFTWPTNSRKAPTYLPSTGTDAVLIQMVARENECTCGGIPPNFCGEMSFCVNECATKEMRAVTAAAKSQEAFAAKEVAALKAEIKDFEKRLAFNRSGVIGGKVHRVQLAPKTRTG